MAVHSSHGQHLTLMFTRFLDMFLQAAWEALIRATSIEALQHALGTELLGIFFVLGGTPSGQALPPQLMFTPNSDSQVSLQPWAMRIGPMRLTVS